MGLGQDSCTILAPTLTLTKQDKTKQNKTRQDRQGRTRQDNNKQDNARSDATTPDRDKTETSKANFCIIFFGHVKTIQIGSGSPPAPVFIWVYI